MSARGISALIIAVLSSFVMKGAELRSETRQAWDDYMAQVSRGMERRAQRKFLWVDELEERLQRVQAGEIVVAPIQPQMPIRVAHGLIHHWIGASFVPDVRIENVIEKIRDYDQYDEFYGPAVSKARSIERRTNPNQGCDRFLLTLVNDHFFSNRALESENTSTYVPVGVRGWYAVSRSVRIQEWAEYGTLRQYKLPVGKGSGFLWSLSTILRFEQRDGGVFVEMEAIALSRDVPMALRFVADPIIRRVSQSAITISLNRTREAVKAEFGGGEQSPPDDQIRKAQTQAELEAQ